MDKINKCAHLCLFTMFYGSKQRKRYGERFLTRHYFRKTSNVKGEKCRNKTAESDII